MYRLFEAISFRSMFINKDFFVILRMSTFFFRYPVYLQGHWLIRYIIEQRVQSHNTLKYIFISTISNNLYWYILYIVYFILYIFLYVKNNNELRCSINYDHFLSKCWFFDVKVVLNTVRFHIFWTSRFILGKVIHWSLYIVFMVQRTKKFILFMLV